MKNFYQVKKTINGTEYTAQCNGLEAALKAVDDSYIDGSSNTSIVKMAKYILENVIVNPSGLQINDFKNRDEFQEVIDFGRGVMNLEITPEDEKEDKKGKKSE